jgi:hypothetical protein
MQLTCTYSHSELYSSEAPTVLNGQQIASHIIRYTPPCVEFELDMYAIAARSRKHLFMYSSAAILCVLGGSAEFDGPGAAIGAVMVRNCNHHGLTCIIYGCAQGTVLLLDAYARVTVVTEDSNVSFVVAHVRGTAIDIESSE